MADRLTSIRKQIAALEERAKDLLRAQNGKVIAKIKALIDKHSLTAEDLGFATGTASKATQGAKRGAAASGTSRATATIGVPRYRDPRSGKTWTGRGKPPAWIVSKDRTRFLIDEADASTAPAKKPRKAAKKVAKAGAAKKAPTASRGAKRPA